MKRLFCLLVLVLVVAHVYAQQDSVSSALRVFGLQMSTAEIDSLRGSLADNLQSYEQIRSLDIPNSTPFPLIFTPPINEAKVPQEQLPVDFALQKKIKLPKNFNDLAFYTVADLSVLIRERKVTSVELTELFLSRLKKYDEQLECVVTLTEELAMEQARRADQEIAAGKYRGPLHGIPYGAKDLLAVVGYPTTWGAAPFRDQVIDETATVIQRLEDAGAVLVAKLSLGALAWGDVWFGGVTKNPWNLEQGSSGSSAGSASATAAGLVPFAIGSETWGSIVSPSTRCGTSGLRPTHGRVSKYGAMALSWTMDKLGPITRSAQDLAIVFDAIYGPDGKDIEVRREVPFNYAYEEQKVKSLRVGYLKSVFHSNDFNPANDSVTLSTLQANGVELIPKELKTDIPSYALSFILSAEAAAAFDDLTRSNLDDELTRQIINSWPNVFRSARFIPAVEYIQANRLRYQLVQDFNAMMADVDVLIAPSFSDQLLITNLTGHPCVVVSNGSYADGTPGSVTFIGNHFDEAAVLIFARYFQSITDFDEEHPELFVK